MIFFASVLSGLVVDCLLTDALVTAAGFEVSPVVDVFAGVVDTGVALLLPARGGITFV